MANMIGIMGRYRRRQKLLGVRLQFFSRYELELDMNMTLGIGPLVSLIAGILILIVPRLLNYIVAVYLIIIGLIGIFGANNIHFG